MITNIHQIIREMKPMLMMDDGRALTESECGDKTPTVTFHPIILSIPCLLFGLNESVQLSYKGFLEFKVVQPDVETIKLLWINRTNHWLPLKTSKQPFGIFWEAPNGRPKCAIFSKSKGSSRSAAHSQHLCPQVQCIHHAIYATLRQEIALTIFAVRFFVPALEVWLIWFFHASQCSWEARQLHDTWAMWRLNPNMTTTKIQIGSQWYPCNCLKIDRYYNP